MLDSPPLELVLAVAAGGLAVVAILIMSEVLEHRRRRRRIAAASGERAGQARGGAIPDRDKSADQRMLELMRQATRSVSIIKDRQLQEARILLVSAGYRGDDALVIYSFLKMVAPLAALTGAALYIYGLSPIGHGPIVDLGAVMAASLVGSMLPDLLLRNMRDKRLAAIKKELPDTLDMLVICAQAGLAADSAIKRVVAETSRRNSILSEELSYTALELSLMPERRIAMDHLAERVPLPSVQALVNTLTQAEKYGTPLSRALKVLAQEQRGERMLRAEEKAGRLPAVMTVPMMIFILPALFIVLIGPAALDIMDNFIGMDR